MQVAENWSALRTPGQSAAGFRRAPAQIADGRRGERDSFIDADIRIGAGDAGELTLFDADGVGDSGGEWKNRGEEDREMQTGHSSMILERDRLLRAQAGSVGDRRTLDDLSHSPIGQTSQSPGNRGRGSVVGLSL